MSSKRGFKWLLTAVLMFGFVLLPKTAFAETENLTGVFTLYNKWTSNSVLGTGYDSTNSSISYPSTSFVQIAPYSTGTYSVVTQMQIQANYNFVSNNNYTLKFRFDYGSYIYPLWPNNSARAWFLSTCPGSNCSISYTYVGDSTHTSTSYLDLTINFKATSNSNSAVFTIGNTTDSIGTFYNAYTSQQGLRISSATVEETDNSVNFDPIINNDNQNTQNIINNQNQNTTNIINNQNENTEKEIESQKVCSTYYSSSLLLNDNGYFNSQGNLISNSTGLLKYSNFIELDNLTILSPGHGGAIYSCFYNSNKELISCVVNDSLQVGDYNLPSGTKFFRFSFYSNGPIFEFSNCKNGNQAISDDINSLNNNLTDTDITGIESGLDDIEEISDTPISDLLTLPLTLLQTIYTGMSDSCSPYQLEFGLWGGSRTISLPCINLGHEKYFGRIVWGIIDDLFCIFMFFNIFKMIIYFYTSWTTLQDNFMYMLDPSNRGGLF